MMRRLVLISMVAFLAACGGKVSDWSEAKVEKWFAASAWKGGLALDVEGSVDKRKLAEQYHANKQAWDAAFAFLENSDFTTAELGRRELDDKGMYANIEEYMTRDSALFEAHHKYIDIQFVPKGCEYIDLTPDKSGGDAIAYNEQRDIEFFATDNFSHQQADSSRILIFFPGEAHRPCMSIDQSIHVRKVVVKIPYIKLK